MFYCRSIYGIVNICKEEETNKGSKDRQFCYLFGHNLGQLFGPLLAEECVMERENNQRRRRIRSATKERTAKHLKRSAVVEPPVLIFTPALNSDGGAHFRFCGGIFETPIKMLSCTDSLLRPQGGLVEHQELNCYLNSK